MTLTTGFINEILDVFITEVSKEETKKKISTYLIEPSMSYVFDRLYPYIMITSIIFILLFLMAIAIICMLLTKGPRS
jgi:membrane-bound ClpP family serine protease